MRCGAWAQACEDGALKYNTGKSCKWGHNSDKYTSTRTCIECAKLAQDNKYKKEWYQKNRDKKLEQSREWYSNNKDKKMASVRLWRMANKEKVKEIRRGYIERNRWYRTEQSARRRARLKNACPAWADRDKIREIYATAQWLKKTTGLRFHVDHIIPLTGEIVCGLHVEANLQILSAGQNQKKHNTFKAVET